MSSRLVDDLRALFALLDPVGGWPAGSEDWTEEEKQDYYNEHSLLNVTPPRPSDMQIGQYLTEMNEAAARLTVWTEDTKEA